MKGAQGFVRRFWYVIYGKMWEYRYEAMTNYTYVDDEVFILMFSSLRVISLISVIKYSRVESNIHVHGLMSSIKKID